MLQYREEVWKAMSGGSGGTLEPAKAIALARHLGFVPSEADEKRLTEGGPVNEQAFDKFIQSIAHTEDTNQEFLIEALKTLDFKNEGTVSEFALQNVLSSLGEPISAAQVSELVERTGSRSGGKVKYKEFVAGLLALNRKLPDTSALKEHGIDVDALPPRTVHEATHFATPPSCLSDYSEAEEEEEDNYKPVVMAPPPKPRRKILSPTQWLTAHAR